MKRRKRTNANVPAKGVLRENADRLWSLSVRARWKNRCAVCGSGKVEAHHLVPRQHEATRYELQNGIALCSMHHQFDKDVSPHQNAAGWMHWLAAYQPQLYHWYLDNQRPQRFDGTKNAAYYCDVIRGLREHVPAEDFERIVGKRFSAWLLNGEARFLRGESNGHP